MVKRLTTAWLALAVGLLTIAPAIVRLRDARPLTEYFLLSQDLPVLLALIGVAAVLRFAPGIVNDIHRALAAFAGQSARVDGRLGPGLVMAALAAACLVAGWLGTAVVYDSYGLSLDEFMAGFGAAIHRHGQLLAFVTPQWREFLTSLQPQFAFHAPGKDYWSSAYLPVNAALRAQAGAMGMESLLAPLLGAASIVAVFFVARRIWPQRPSIALVAALLLATSSQLLVTAMTPYAMSAHLALNSTWLWLFLRGGRLGHTGAIAVAFFACGLHELVFHPLFAAPFVLQCWLERRWRLAALYSMAYAATCLFWIDYWPIAQALAGAAPAAAARGAAGAIGGFGALGIGLLRAFDPAGAGLMAMNLIRFATWQNPLTAPLLLLGGVAAFRAKGTLRSLILGIALTLAAMVVLLPYQGHGWGYRYLHGLLGSACLLAAWTWDRLTQGLAGAERGVARLALLVIAALSVCVLFPLRAWQAHAFVHPYARADHAIRHADADLVLVDDIDGWFTIDLVRNDPYLRNRPIVMDLKALSDVQLSALCGRYSVALFDDASAAGFGIRVAKPGPGETDVRSTLAEVRVMRCGPSRAPVREIKAAPDA